MKVLIIPPQVNPIPAVRGGAVESLLTNFINENEKKKRLELYIISKKDLEAERYNYLFTKIYYVSLDPDTFDFEDKRNYKKYKIFCFFRKIIFNRVTKILFKKVGKTIRDLTYFGFLTKIIAKKIKPDIVLSEGFDKIHQLWPLSRLIGPENCYYHLHYCRKENADARELFNNSISVSNYVKQGWVKNNSLSGRNTVIFNGIEIDRFSSRSPNKSILELKRELHIDPSNFVVGFAARFRPGKGILELIKAFKIIKNNNIKLLLMGGFVDYKKNHDDFKNEIISEIRDNQNIIYVGNVSYSLIQDYYSLCDVLVICSVYEEAAGLVGIEGMAKGLPLIITKTGGLPEYVSQDCSIQLDVSKNLPYDISESILTFYHDKELRKQYGIKARAFAKRFDSKYYYNEMCDFLMKQTTTKE